MSNGNTLKPTRRESIGIGAGVVGAAIGFPTFVPSRVLGKDAPSNRITMGFIGVGGHGLGYNLNHFLKHKDQQVLAVCDVFESRRRKALTYVEVKSKSNACKSYGDFREVLERKDIDAVAISTPDHWHVPLSLLGLKAGKDVFCEKPTLTIAEGRELVNTVEKHKAVFQAGIEDRSVDVYHRMCQIVRNGGIGKLQRMDVVLPDGEFFAKEKTAPVPKELDWNLWLGPAPFVPYSPMRTNRQAWRNIRDYSGGKLTDWGAHLIDSAQVANNAESSGPVRVHGKGVIPENAMNTVPRTYDIHYTYANGVEMRVKSGGVAIRLEGTDGWIGNKGWRGKLAASSPSILKQAWPVDKDRIWSRPPLEHRNFLDCVKSRKLTTYNAEQLHRLSTVMHIGNIAMELGRTLDWDPKSESFKDADANALRSRKSRDWE